MNLLGRSCLALTVVFLAAACSSEGTQTKLDAAVAGFDAPFFDTSTPSDAALEARFVDDATPDAVTDAGADGSVRCTPNALRCQSFTSAERCAPTGDAWRSLACTNGCVDDACKPTVFSNGWTKHQFQPRDDLAEILANYVVSDEGLVVTQTSNPWPSAYLNNEVLESVEMTGRFSVNTPDDDDFIGFVMGWQDPEHFYLFDWKQAAQDNVCGIANVGAAFKVVNSESPLANCADFWNALGTAKVKPLSDPQKNVTGWKANTVYTFRLVFRPGDLRLEIKDDSVTVVSLVSKDTSYTSGRIGFYNYSQKAVRYEQIQVQPASSL